MKVCIICRTQKENFNDEHVIPDSIRGYYHIYSVCTDCNSKLGSKIDNTLTNHKLIEFHRFLHGIKGKSGSIPNPLRAIHTVEGKPDHKVVLEVDSDGKFTPKLLPIVPELKKELLVESFTIMLDKKDEAKMPGILSKICKRLDISEDRIQSEIIHDEFTPILQAKLEIDTHSFKMALLKIAYEFAVDSIPTYFDDTQAKVISGILFNANFDELTKKVKFIGSGFNDAILAPFEHYIDFKNDNHYLILHSGKQGLLCFINLFNAFSIGIVLSNHNHFIHDELLIGKNDISKGTFEKLGITQLLDLTFTPMEYRFGYRFTDKASQDEFNKMQGHPNFGPVEKDGLIQFLDKDGKVLYNDIDLKLAQPQLQIIKKGDTVNTMIDEIIMDEELYIKHHPNNKLYRIRSVQGERHRKRKI